MDSFYARSIEYWLLIEEIERRKRTLENKSVVSVDLLRSLNSKHGIMHICMIHYANGDEELREVNTKDLNSKFIKYVNRNGRNLAYGLPKDFEIR